MSPGRTWTRVGPDKKVDHRSKSKNTQTKTARPIQTPGMKLKQSAVSSDEDTAARWGAPYSGGLEPNAVASSRPENNSSDSEA